MAAPKEATIKYSVKTATISSNGSGPLWDIWPHLLISIGGPDERMKALNEAMETHKRLVVWEAEQAAKKAGG